MKIGNYNDNLNWFKTSDLALASVISLFIPLEEINKENPRKADFVFKQSKKLEEIIKQYWNRELQIEPRQFFDQIKAIKTRLYS